MKKYILLFLIILSFNNIFAQFNKKDSSEYNSPGKELKLFYKEHAKGTYFVLGGSLMYGYSIYKNKSLETPLGLVGTVLFIIGFYDQFNSYKHIKQAGIILDNNKIGIVVNIN